jgi:hypothetical protein
MDCNIQDRTTWLAEQVSTLIALANVPGIMTKQCDEAALPLIQHLIASGEIPDDHAFVEWQGALEHDVIAVCHTSGDPMKDGWKETWLNINRNGTIDRF